MRTVRRGLYVALLLVFLLHNDLWLWRDPRVILGLPIGLLYHVTFCLVVAMLMFLLVRFAWPSNLEEPDGNPGS